MEGYYTFTQRARGAAGLINSYTLNVDDHWWTANLVLSLANPTNTRYAGAMDRFTDAWTQNGILVDPTGIVNSNGLAVAGNDAWTALTAAGSNAFVMPGPLGSNMRAMAYITLHASVVNDETAVQRDATCFAKGQLRCATWFACCAANVVGDAYDTGRNGDLPPLTSERAPLCRHVLGVNDAARSYVVGLAIDGASYPKQVYDRASSCPADPASGCGSSFFSSGAANPSVLVGAVVQGPSVAGAFSDARTTPQFTGVSILNNSPLTLLAASLHGRALSIQDCIGLNPKASLGRTNSAAVILPSI